MGADATNTNANPGTGDGQETQVKTFDELLNDESYKSEYDKRLAQELASAKSEWETEQQKKLDAEKTEAEKMASMNAKEQEDYKRKKREEALAEREREITTRELKATAYETLTEKGLPKELAEILNYTDADQCKASIDVVEKTFNSALTKAVNEKLKGTAHTPKKGGEVKDTPLFDFSFTGVRPKK